MDGVALCKLLLTVKLYGVPNEVGQRAYVDILMLIIVRVRRVELLVRLHLILKE